MHNSARGERCRETGLWLVSADVTGERDGRISWGPTVVLDPAGEAAAQLPLEETGLLVVDIPQRFEIGVSGDGQRCVAGDITTYIICTLDRSRPVRQSRGRKIGRRSRSPGDAIMSPRALSAAGA